MSVTSAVPAAEPTPAAVPPQAPVPAGDDAAKKREELRALLDERNKETKEFADATSIRSWLRTGSAISATAASFGWGMLLALYLSDNQNAGPAGCTGCGLIATGLAATMGFGIAELLAPSPTKEAAEVDEVQKKLDDAAMAF